MSELTLVSHTLCPYVQRAVIALSEKGVDFRRVYIDLGEKPDWFTAISPLGKVPLLIVESPGRDRAVLFESSVICEFIEETQSGRPLHPENPIDRARHRAWIEFASSILGDIYGIETTPDAVVFDAKRRSLETKFQKLEETLGEGPYFSGDAFSLVDAAFAPVFRYFDVFETIVDLRVLDAKRKVARWRTALAQRPSARNAVAEDYNDLLWAFLERQTSYLRAYMREHGARAAEPVKLTAAGG